MKRLLSACLACLIFIPGLRSGTDTLRFYPVGLIPDAEKDTIFAMINHRIRGQHKESLDSAIRIYEEAYFRARKIAHVDGMYWAASKIGIVNNELGRYDQALAWFRLSLNYAMQSKHTSKFSARILNNIGDIFLYQGKYEEALTFMFMAARFAEQEAWRNNSTADVLSRIYNNIATTLLYMNEDDRALYYLNKGAVLAEKARFPERLANILNNKARIWQRKGDMEQARQCIYQALAIARQYKPSRVEYTALQTMAEIFLAENRPGKAIPYLQQALQSGQYVNPYYTSGIFYTMGSCYLANGDYRQAQQWLKKAFDAASKARIAEYLYYIHQKMAALHAAMHQYREAFLHQQKANELNNILLNRQKTEAVNLLEIRYRTAEKDKELIQKQLLISEQQNYLKQKNIWIYGISCGALLLTLLSFSYYRSFRHKQKVYLLKAMITGEEKERVRIGRELHDGIGGRMAAINMNFGAVQRRYTAFEGKDELEQIMTMLDETAQEVRNTAHNLIPDILSRHSFPEAIRLYCEQSSNRQLQIQVHIEDCLPELPNKSVELMLYRIIQELVQNMVKHARATQAAIAITWSEKELILIAEDNGTGFNLQKSRKGIGLQNILSRVKLLQGHITIDAANGRGTSISITFDMNRLKTILSDENQDRHNG